MAKSERRLLPWRRLWQGLALIAGIGFLLVLLRAQWAELRAYPWRVEGVWLLVSLPPLALSWALEIALWCVCLRSLDGRLSFRQASLIWFLSNAVRYIPGNVWQFIGMATLAAEEDVPAEATLTSIVVHQALSATAVVTLGAGYLAWTGRGETWHLALPGAALAAIVAVGLRSRWVERGLNLGLRVLKRPPLRLTLTTPQLALMLAGYGGAWILAGLGFAALVRALTPAPWALTPHLTASFIIAYFIGYISLLTPSGLGVREGAMVWLLSGFLAAPLPTIAALLGRVWLTASELIGVGLALALWRRDRSTRAGRLTGVRVDG